MKSRLAVVAALVVLGTAPAHAQDILVQPYRQQISANPFGLLFEIFNAEYERVISESATVGVGGSTIADDDDRYVNADAFFRFYPSGRPLDGWAFGAKVGVTRIEGDAYFGYGFDVNRSWLLGRKNNFYVGIGFGLKRLVGEPRRSEPTLEDPLQEDLFWRHIPTIRIVNVGFAF